MPNAMSANAPTAPPMIAMTRTLEEIALDDVSGLADTLAVNRRRRP